MYKNKAEGMLSDGNIAINVALVGFRNYGSDKIEIVEEACPEKKQLFVHDGLRSSVVGSTRLTVNNNVKLAITATEYRGYLPTPGSYDALAIRVDYTSEESIKKAIEFYKQLEEDLTPGFPMTLLVTNPPDDIEKDKSLATLAIRLGAKKMFEISPKIQGSSSSAVLLTASLGYKYKELSDTAKRKEQDEIEKKRKPLIEEEKRKMQIEDCCKAVGNAIVMSDIESANQAYRELLKLDKNNEQKYKEYYGDRINNLKSEKEKYMPFIKKVIKSAIEGMALPGKDPIPNKFGNVKMKDTYEQPLTTLLFALLKGSEGYSNSMAPKHENLLTYNLSANLHKFLREAKSTFSKTVVLGIEPKDIHTNEALNTALKAAIANFENEISRVSNEHELPRVEEVGRVREDEESLRKEGGTVESGEEASLYREDPTQEIRWSEAGEDESDYNIESASVLSSGSKHSSKFFSSNQGEIADRLLKCIRVENRRVLSRYDEPNYLEIILDDKKNDKRNAIYNAALVRTLQRLYEEEPPFIEDNTIRLNWNSLHSESVRNFRKVFWEEVATIYKNENEKLLKDIPSLPEDKCNAFEKMLAEEQESIIETQEEMEDWEVEEEDLAGKPVLREAEKTKLQEIKDHLEYLKQRDIKNRAFQEKIERILKDKNIQSINALVEEYQEKRKIKDKKEALLAIPQINAFYSTFKKELNSLFISSSLIGSGNIARAYETKADKASKIMQAVSHLLPSFAGSLTSVVAASIKRINNNLEREKNRKQSQWFSTFTEMENVVEKLALALSDSFKEKFIKISMEGRECPDAEKLAMSAIAKIVLYLSKSESDLEGDLVQAFVSAVKNTRLENEVKLDVDRAKDSVDWSANGFFSTSGFDRGIEVSASRAKRS